MRKEKKGIVLIECIIYISLSVILTMILAKIIINTDYVYVRSMKNYIVESNINDFFINIERFLNEDNVQKIEVKDNMIIIYKGTLEKNFQKEEIYKDKDKIMIKYYDIRNFENYNARNTLAINIEGFTLKKKGKVIYACVRKEGKEYIKCL